MINKPVAAPNPPPLFTRPRPAPRHEDRVVYAIGSKVIVTASSEGQRLVEMMDEKGHPSPLRVKVETRTEVTAWRPQRSGAARYRIRAEDGTEGWIEAANVRRVPPPPRPIFVTPKVVVPPPKKAAARKPKARPGKIALAPAAPVATKPATKVAAKAVPQPIAPAPPARGAASPKKPVAPTKRPAKPAPNAKKTAAKKTTKPLLKRTAAPRAKKKKK